MDLDPFSLFCSTIKRKNTYPTYKYLQNNEGHFFIFELLICESEKMFT